ncbi:MAG: hypothetical protein PVI90_00445 [Desulfobacteraceae bacterium]|jgi:hypothetical protein
MVKHKNKLSCRFIAKNGGSVKLCGLMYGEQVPEAIHKLLLDYGFMDFGAVGKSYVYVDCLSSSPYVDSDTALRRISMVVDIQVCRHYKKGGVSSLTDISERYMISIDTVSVMGPDVHFIIPRIFRAWNKAGRPIRRVPLINALRKLLDKVNTERC